MKHLITIAFCALMTGCTSSLPVTESPCSRRLARFEILGMLDEYMGRTLEEDFVERFYPSERRAASRFRDLLRELCVSEKISPDWRRIRGPEGHIYFESATIAATLNSHYSLVPAYWIGGTVGYLQEDALRSASRAELICFVRGSYTRFGDKRRRPIFKGANLAEKFRLLGDVIKRLGCDEVCLYDDRITQRIPTSYTLTFQPTPELIQILGVRPQLSDADVKELVCDNRIVDGSLKPDIKQGEIHFKNSVVRLTKDHRE